MYLWRTTVIKCIDDLDVITIHVRNAMSGNNEKIVSVTHALIGISYRTVYITFTDNPALENLAFGVLYVMNANDYVFDFYNGINKIYTQGVRIKP